MLLLFLNTLFASCNLFFILIWTYEALTESMVKIFLYLMWCVYMTGLTCSGCLWQKKALSNVQKHNNTFRHSFLSNSLSSCREGCQIQSVSTGSVMGSVQTVVPFLIWLHYGQFSAASCCYRILFWLLEGLSIFFPWWKYRNLREFE